MLLVGGCTFLGLRDPCTVDFPPGDQFSRTITNDTPNTIALVGCDDERCHRGFYREDVASHASTDVIVEACSTETLAVADPQTRNVLGCLTQQGDELGAPFSANDRQVSRRHPCAGDGGKPFKVRLYDPAR